MARAARMDRRHFLALAGAAAASALTVAGDGLLGTPATGAALASPEPPAGATVFEGGFGQNLNGINLVSLYGTWEQMGRQYGHLLKDALQHIYTDMLYDPWKDNPAMLAQMQATALTFYEDYPAKFKRFFEGMSQTSGLTVEQLQLCNAVESIYTVETPAETPVEADAPHCSGLAVCGPYTSDGTLVYGRNYDYGELFLRFKDYVCVAVFHPADGSLSCATVGYAGEIYCVNGMNEAGVFLELNNGSKSSSAKDDARITSITELFALLLDASDLDYVDEFFNTTGCSSSYLIGAADAERARSYEWCTLGAKVGDTTEDDGAMAQANHFVNPDWGFPTPADADCWYSLTRRANLLSLAEADKGAIDTDAMQRIMSTWLDDGGAMEEYTVYQLVAVPQTRTLWVAVTDGAPWTRIELGEYF